MLNLDEKVNLLNYTLILPSISIGNVGQLSVDLLISTLNLRRAGRIFNICFIPVVGANPYNKTIEDICTAADLYVSEEKELVALQIRSPLVKKVSKFFYEILNFILDYKISKVIVLTSSYDHEKQDEQIRTPPFRYLTTKNVTAKFRQQFEDLSWIVLELKLLDKLNDQTNLKIYGGGYAKIIFEFFQKNNIICVILLKFCSEGNNIPDSVELINYFNRYVKMIPVNNVNKCKLKFPSSWKFLFGNYPPKEIY